MDATLLDTLVKLASLGASGICIFAIFWIGWLIQNQPPTKDPERHRTLRLFMITTVVIASISAVSGIANALINSGKIAELKAENKSATERLTQEKEQTAQELSVAKASIADYRQREAEVNKLTGALSIVLHSKEAANLENPSSEVASHIKILRQVLKEMPSAVGSPQ